MHTIIETEENLWTVIYQGNPGDEFQRALGDYDNFNDAAAVCSWLNGGLPPLLCAKLIEGLKIGGGLRQ